MITLGLAVPFTEFARIGSAAFQDAEVVAFVLLTELGIAAGMIFIMTLLNPGKTIAAEFQPATRKVDLVRSVEFAHTVYTVVHAVPFNRIAPARIETHYDDDGYKTLRPLLIRRPREAIELPAGTTPDDVAAINAMLGLA